MSISPSVEAITLARAAFDSMQAKVGLIKFSIEELIPVDKNDSTDPKIWDLTCSFYESLGSPTPSKYNAIIDLNNKTVSIKKIGGGETERKFTITEQKDSAGTIFTQDSVGTSQNPKDYSTPPQSIKTE